MDAWHRIKSQFVLAKRVINRQQQKKKKKKYSDCWAIILNETENQWFVQCYWHRKPLKRIPFSHIRFIIYFRACARSRTHLFTYTVCGSCVIFIYYSLYIIFRYCMYSIQPLNRLIFLFLFFFIQIASSSFQQQVQVNRRL